MSRSRRPRLGDRVNVYVQSQIHDTIQATGPCIVAKVKTLKVAKSIFHFQVEEEYARRRRWLSGMWCSEDQVEFIESPPVEELLTHPIKQIREVGLELSRSKESQ